MKKILIISLLSMGQLSLAQSLVLDQYVAEALSSNLSLKQQNLELEKALKAIDIAKANLAPKVVFNPNYTLAAGGRKLDFPIGDLLNPVYNTLNQLTKSSAFPQVENVSQQLAPNNFHETKLSVQYPIFNSDAKLNIALQKELFLTEEAKKKVLEYEIAQNVKVAYFQYLQVVEAQKITENSLGFLNRYLAFNQKLVANQTATKEVVLSAELEINKLKQQIISLKKNQKVAQAYFNFLLNRDLHSSIDIDPQWASSLPTLLPLEELKLHAQTERPEFAQLKAGQSAQQAVLKLQEANAKYPQVFVGGSTGFQGFGYQFKNQAYAIMQLGLNWDLYHGYEKKHKIQQTKIQQNILATKIDEVKNQVALQVAQAYDEVQAAQEIWLSAQENLSKTESLLKLVEAKYKNQNALYIEVLKAQNDDLTAQLMASVHRFDLWVKKAHLDKVSGH